MSAPCPQFGPFFSFGIRLEAFASLPQSHRLWCRSEFPLVSVLQLLAQTPDHRRAEPRGADSPGLERSVRGVMNAVNCTRVLVGKSNIGWSYVEPMVVTGIVPGLW